MRERAVLSLAFNPRAANAAALGLRTTSFVADAAFAARDFLASLVLQAYAVQLRAIAVCTAVLAQRFKNNRNSTE